MYAMVCHSGALGGGHYVSYSKTESGTWFCHNDSACKEVPETSIDKSTAYILLYEREGLSLSGEKNNENHLSLRRRHVKISVGKLDFSILPVSSWFAFIFGYNVVFLNEISAL
jgi:Ubiquitin carboxyl-terminal hydrolase